MRRPPPPRLLAAAALLACGTPPPAGLPDGTTAGTGTTDLPTSTTATSTTPTTGATSSTAAESTTTAATTGTDTGDPAQGFALLSLNLHCFRLDGTAFATNAARFAAIAALAAARDVAVLTLQEACERPGEQAIEQLRAALEGATGESWSSTWAFAHVAWEGTPDEADEGVGLLVRGALDSPDSLQFAVQGSLRRVAVSADLPPALGGLRVTSAHFEVFEAAARTLQAREAAVAALVDADGFAALVAGDFNDVEGSPTFAAFTAMGYLAADAGLAPDGIDHVMLHRAAALRPDAVERVFLGPDAVSDHPGVLVHLSPARGDVVTATRVTADYDPGPGFLAIRGDLAPLAWDLGYPLRRTGPAESVFVTTELAADFAFKLLLDDTTWQTGPNAQGTAGAAQTVAPTF